MTIGVIIDMDELDKPPKVPPQTTNDWSFAKVFELSAKISLGIAFFIYGIGFTIWYSYLGQFGVYPPNLPQFSFLSAASCYLFYIILFPLPAGVLIYHLLKPTEESYKTAIGELILRLWFVPLVFLSNFYFYYNQPKTNLSFSDPHIRLFIVIGIVGAAHVLIYWTKRLWGKNSNKPHTIGWEKWVFVYLVCLTLGSTYLSREIHLQFLIYTIFVPLLFFLKEIETLQDSNSFYHTERSLKIFLVIILISALVTHVYYFAIWQFESVPRRSGGGRAALVLLHPKQEMSEQLISSLELPRKGHFLGPVRMILQTENQIIFFLKDEWGKSGKKIARALDSKLIDGIQYLDESQIEENLKKQTKEMDLTWSQELDPAISWLRNLVKETIFAEFAK